MNPNEIKALRQSGTSILLWALFEYTKFSSQREKRVFFGLIDAGLFFVSISLLSFLLPETLYSTPDVFFGTISNSEYRWLIVIIGTFGMTLVSLGERVKSFLEQEHNDTNVWIIPCALAIGLAYIILFPRVLANVKRTASPYSSAFFVYVLSSFLFCAGVIVFTVGISSYIIFKQSSYWMDHIIAETLLIATSLLPICSLFNPWRAEHDPVQFQ
jgi:hypothetical protein